MLLLVYFFTLLSTLVNKSTSNNSLQARATSYTSKGTYWGGNWAGGNCGFSTWPQPSNYPEIAIAGNLWESGAYCGACLEVTGPDGNVKVGIVGDQCPSCTTNGLDMDPTMWAAVTGNASPSIKDITWEVVSCGFSTPIQLINKVGVSAYWFSMQVAGANNPVKSLEISTDKGKTWTTTTRQSSSNFFQPDQASQGNSGNIRVTCNNGKKIFTENVSFTSSGIQNGSGNC
ncbi:Non-catalytic module family EXPN [Melampsora larici-populina 98AG31]|uniref:Non-catalytic module family EXPN n=1 Tax=Melampsora larici-populina (strain 98AG31 / pathotype 3-4-7) TaxID=747676 RepID=F4R416_MELLP|nr:Non-catalytic module family EXPN [Melampsora larici-populina 98AG31]EGG12721.1 Non-catalytic module family EXPN [Melampsora larici-populina 98AG31]